jgi:hypothetical protein
MRPQFRKRLLARRQTRIGAIVCAQVQPRQRRMQRQLVKPRAVRVFRKNGRRLSRSAQQRRRSRERIGPRAVEVGEVRQTRLETLIARKIVEHESRRGGEVQQPQRARRTHAHARDARVIAVLDQRLG